MKLSSSFVEIDKTILSRIKPYISKVYEVYSKNFRKILKAFNEERISSIHFNPTFGYGLLDYGTEKVEKVYEKVIKENQK